MSHRIHTDLFEADNVMPDPGDAGSIRVTGDLLTCEMVSGASAETRTLENPTKPGIRFMLMLITDGGGDITVRAANGLNPQNETEAVFADAGDRLNLISVTKTAATATSGPVYRWDVLASNYGVTIA